MKWGRWAERFISRKPSHQLTDKSVFLDKHLVTEILLSQELIRTVAAHGLALQSRSSKPALCDSFQLRFILFPLQKSYEILLILGVKLYKRGRKTISGRFPTLGFSNSADASGAVGHAHLVLTQREIHTSIIVIKWPFIYIFLLQQKLKNNLASHAYIFSQILIFMLSYLIFVVFISLVDASCHKCPQFETNKGTFHIIL